MTKVEMVNSNFYKVTEESKIVGAIMSIRNYEEYHIFFMNKDFIDVGQTIIPAEIIYDMDIAEYERFLTKKWEERLHF